MKRTILFLAVILMTSSAAFAQKKETVKTAKATAAPVTTNVVAQKAQVGTDVEKALKFEKTVHNFGTVPEGPAASYDFVFKNTSNKPVKLESVRASCGCTTPYWSKDEIGPGKTSKITVSYNTKGRPGNIYKTITVKSTAGQKVLTIKGNVEKAPTSSVPTNNNSMIKH